MSIQPSPSKEQEAPLQAPASIYPQQTIRQEQDVPQPSQRSPRSRVARWWVIGTLILVLALILSLGIILIPGLLQRPGAQVIPKPTSPAALETPMPGTTTTPPSGLAVYTGKGYSIGYPKDWKIEPGDQTVIFSSVTGMYSLLIVVNPNPDGIISASTMVNDNIAAFKGQMTNSRMETLPATTIVGGENWAQKSISGTETSGGVRFDLQAVVISDNHPANSADTRNFTITYSTERSLFATANTSYFQQMLRSFKFI